MFKITPKAKNGGIWDGKRTVKLLETDDVSVAERLKAQGCTVEKIEEDVALESMTAAQLKKYAKKNKIDIGDAASAEDILAIIKAATEGGTGTHNE